MPLPEHAQVSIPDPAQLAQSLARVANRSHQLVLDFLTRAPEFPAIGMADPQNVGRAFLDLTTKMIADPMAIARAQLDLWTEHALLWTDDGAKDGWACRGQHGEELCQTAASNIRDGAKLPSSTTSNRAT